MQPKWFPLHGGLQDEILRECCPAGFLWHCRLVSSGWSVVLVKFYSGLKEAEWALAWSLSAFWFLSSANMRYTCLKQMCLVLVSTQQGRALWSINIPQLPTRGAATTQSGMTSVKALKGPICNTNKWACLVFCLRGLARHSCNCGNPGCRVALLIGWQLQQHH